MASSTKCKRLEGKVAIITASTEGIGFAIAERLAKEGARVVVSSRKQVNVDKAVQQLRKNGAEVLGVVCHVSKTEDRDNLISQTVKHFGGIDILVSNAAISPYFGSFMETSEQVWDKVFEVNLKAMFLLCKAVYPHMLKRGGGSIVLVSSIGGYISEENIGAYGISKTALFGLTRTLAVSLASSKIRVNCIAPGVIKTHLSEMLWKTPEIAERIMNDIPLLRLGESDDCAGPVAFFVSDDASYITGETIVIAGGRYARL